jgi:hypothetical protein
MACSLATSRLEARSALTVQPARSHHDHRVHTPRAYGDAILPTGLMHHSVLTAVDVVGDPLHLIRGHARP